jgi:hypothetical protein
LRLTPNRRSRVDGTRVLADRNALRGFGAYKTGVHKELAKAKTGFARARIMGGGAAPAGVPSFVHWRATQNKAMNSYIIDIAL